MKTVWQQVDGPAALQKQNTHDHRNCSDNNGERSTSVDWRTADADDQQRRRLVCSCSPGMAELLTEDTHTSAWRA